MGAGIPIGIPIIALFSVFQWCSVLNKWWPFCSDFQQFGFGSFWTITIAIAMTDHSITEPLEIETSNLLVFNVQYSDLIVSLWTNEAFSNSSV